MAEAEQFKSALLTLLADVFWQRVNKTDGCWLYTGIVDRWGYGAVIVFERRFKAHRVSWMLHYGDIPGDMRVCHKCDVTRCVRPDHLFLGTQAENLEDMGKKGRRAVGERAGRSKLTEQIVRQIHAAVLSGAAPLEAAREFSVSSSLVSGIARGHAWKHLGLPVIPARKNSGLGLRTHCKYGHEFTPENTMNYNGPKGPQRRCRACDRRRGAAFREKVRQAWASIPRRSTDSTSSGPTTHGG